MSWMFHLSWDPELQNDDTFFLQQLSLLFLTLFFVT